MSAGLSYAMSEAEIAEELGLSKAAVKMILVRALAKIRARPEMCQRFRAAVEDRRKFWDRGHR
jgi:DNA-directed RNA polymerase specialized sigma24 family protein